MGKGDVWNSGGSNVRIYQVTTGLFKQVESNIEYARTVFNEMVARNMPVQLLSISIDGVDILDEYRGRCEDAI